MSSIDLAGVAHLPEGEEVLRRGDAIGKPILIKKAEPPTEPPNAWILPDDLAAATGGGDGCGSTIVYDPAEWPRKGDPRSPSSARDLVDDAAPGKSQRRGKERSRRVPTGETNERAAMSDTRNSATLRLDCQPSKAGNLLLFPYTLENQGPGDVYAMHALAERGPGQPRG